MELLTKMHDLIDSYADVRVKDWLGMSSPIPTIVLSFAYVVIVKYLGPKLMENRKPFELRKVIIAYNFFQVVLSAKLFYDACTLGWFTFSERQGSWRCAPLTLEPADISLRIARGCWLYYISKFTEFFDTFFFVMRKRYDQVSTLHVIHHAIMPVSVWWGVKIYPGGHGTFFGLLNTGVHVVMYSYYMLAAVGPHMQKYLWWKRYLTRMQMIQFVAVFIHAMQLFFHNPCNYPIAYSYVAIVHAVMFFFLFQAFYMRSYTSKNSASFKISPKMLDGMCFPDINKYSTEKKEDDSSQTKKID